MLHLQICNTIDSLKRFVFLGLEKKISTSFENSEIFNKKQYELFISHSKINDKSTITSQNKMISGFDLNQNYLLDHKNYEQSLNEKITPNISLSRMPRSVGRGILKTLIQQQKTFATENTKYDDNMNRFKEKKATSISSSFIESKQSENVSKFFRNNFIEKTVDPEYKQNTLFEMFEMVDQNVNQYIKEDQLRLTENRKDKKIIMCDFTEKISKPEINVPEEESNPKNLKYSKPRSRLPSDFPIIMSNLNFNIDSNKKKEDPNKTL